MGLELTGSHLTRYEQVLQGRSTRPQPHSKHLQEREESRKGRRRETLQRQESPLCVMNSNEGKSRLQRHWTSETLSWNHNLRDRIFAVAQGESQKLKLGNFLLHRCVRRPSFRLSSVALC